MKTLFNTFSIILNFVGNGLLKSTLILLSLLCGIGLLSDSFDQLQVGHLEAPLRFGRRG